MRTRGAANEALQNALKRANLDATLTTHCLRHTFAATWLQDGGDIFRLSWVLGHADARETQDTYGHLIPGAHLK